MSGHAGGSAQNIQRISEVLIARGADPNLVRGIAGDRRLPAYEKIMLFADIHHKIMTTK